MGSENLKICIYFSKKYFVHFVPRVKKKIFCRCAFYYHADYDASPQSGLPQQDRVNGDPERDTEVLRSWRTLIGTRELERTCQLPKRELTDCVIVRSRASIDCIDCVLAFM